MAKKGDKKTVREDNEVLSKPIKKAIKKAVKKAIKKKTTSDRRSKRPPRVFADKRGRFIKVKGKRVPIVSNLGKDKLAQTIIQNVSIGREILKSVSSKGTNTKNISPDKIPGLLATRITNLQKQVDLNAQSVKKGDMEQFDKLRQDFQQLSNILLFQNLLAPSEKSRQQVADVRNQGIEINSDASGSNSVDLQPAIKRFNKERSKLRKKLKTKLTEEERISTEDSIDVLDIKLDTAEGIQLAEKKITESFPPQPTPTPSEVEPDKPPPLEKFDFEKAVPRILEDRGVTPKKSITLSNKFKKIQLNEDQKKAIAKVADFKIPAKRNIARLFGELVSSGQLQPAQVASTVSGDFELNDLIALIQPKPRPVSESKPDKPQTTSRIPESETSSVGMKTIEQIESEMESRRAATDLEEQSRVQKQREAIPIPPPPPPPKSMSDPEGAPSRVKMPILSFSADELEERARGLKSVETAPKKETTGTFGFSAKELQSRISKLKPTETAPTKAREDFIPAVGFSDQDLSEGKEKLRKAVKTPIVDPTFDPQEAEETGIEGTGRSFRGAGLFDNEIEKMMVPFQKFGFQGVISADEMPLLEPEIPMSFIMNTDPSDKPGKHWQACNINDSSVEFFDSFGEDPSDMFLKDLRGVVQKLSPEQYLKLKINKVVQQHANSNNCGFFAMKFLIERMQGKPFPEATKFSKVRQGEKDIKEFKEGFGYI